MIPICISSINFGRKAHVSHRRNRILIAKIIQDKREEALQLAQKGQGDLGVQTIQDASELMKRHSWLSYAPFPVDAVRGVWHRPVEKTQEAIGQTLDKLKSAGINTVFLETFFHGYTIFPSETFQAYGLTNENPISRGRRSFKMQWVEEAHARNMKVETWFQTFYAGTKAYHPPGPILIKYPSWANVQYSALIAVTPPSVPPVNSAPANLSSSSRLIPPVQLKSNPPLKNTTDKNTLEDPNKISAKKDSADPLEKILNTADDEPSDMDIQPQPKPEMKSPARPMPSRWS